MSIFKACGFFHKKSPSIDADNVALGQSNQSNNRERLPMAMSSKPGGITLWESQNLVLGRAGDCGDNQMMDDRKTPYTNILLHQGRNFDFEALQNLHQEDVSDSGVAGSGYKRCQWTMRSPENLPTSLDTDKSCVAPSLEGENVVELMQMNRIRAKCLTFERTNANLEYAAVRLDQENNNLAKRIELLKAYNNRLKVANVEYVTSTAENAYLEASKVNLKEMLNDLDRQVDSQDDTHYRLLEDFYRINKDKKKMEQDKLVYELTSIDTQDKLGDLSKRVEQLEALKEDFQKKRMYIRQLQETVGILRVFVRIRPALNSSSVSCLTSPTIEKVVIKMKNDSSGGGAMKKASPSSTGSGAAFTSKTFHFNRVFKPEASQHDVYEEISGLVQMTLSGYNCCLFSFGMSGSGKTHTLLGNSNKPGVASFAFTDIVQMVDADKSRQFSVQLSFLDLFHDRLYCALSRKKLKILDSGSIVSVKGQEEHEVQSIQQMHDLLQRALATRKTGKTAWNTAASLSHFFVVIKVASSSLHFATQTTGLLILGDLAGFDKQSSLAAERPNPHHPSALRVASNSSSESNYINKSLVSLLLVIEAIKTKNKTVPYRSCKLTHFLKPCFSGNAVCCLLLTVSPEEHNAYSTLRSLNLGETTMNTVVGAPKHNIQGDAAASSVICSAGGSGGPGKTGFVRTMSLGSENSRISSGVSSRDKF